MTKHDEEIVMTSNDTPPTGAPDLPPGKDGDMPTVLVDQIEFHVREFMRGRLDGLTDEEYVFDPTARGTAWSVHPRVPEGEAPPTSIQGGSGDMVIDFEFPEPEPTPFTTIAWRLGHIIVGILAARSHSHFGGPPADYGSWTYAATAQEALAQFDAEYDRWIAGVRSWSADDLQVAVGEAEGPWAEYSRATLVAHINRELIHHLAEIAVIRDLWAHRG
jgi:DinB superfamily